MKINETKAIIFSPCESTKRLMRVLGRKTPSKLKQVDVTVFKDRNQSSEFGEQDLAIFSSPVFFGRLPKEAKQRFSGFKGNNTPAVIFMTYGNRAFDDALVELFDQIKEQGFIPIAAAAFVAKHSILNEFADGKPGFEDRDEAEKFMSEVSKKIEQADCLDDIKIDSVDGSRPYRSLEHFVILPEVNERCIKCSHCAANCPVDAIPWDEPNTTNFDKCISCMRCVKLCPHMARYIPEEQKDVLRTRIAEMCSIEKRNYIII